MAPPSDPVCGAVCGRFVCDREPDHTGSHRGYYWEIDAPVFWKRGTHETRTEADIRSTKTTPR
jgi:hypothetical protein